METLYSINATQLSAGAWLITDMTTTNISLWNSVLDLYRAYNVTVTSYNNGGIGPVSFCTVYIPDGNYKINRLYDYLNYI